MRIIDTHCHYNLSPLVESWADHWHQAQSRGVTHGIIVGTTVETSFLANEIAFSEPNLFAAAAIHPSEYQKSRRDSKYDLKDLEPLFTQPNVIAIGETGLDYFRLPENPDERERSVETQKTAFRLHVKAASTFSLPLILHVRDSGEQAYWDTLAILEAHLPKDHPFVLHCLSGPAAYVKQAVALGAYCGLAGNITYPSSEPLRTLVRELPPERLLLETDAPFLAPVPQRGKTCEPWMIRGTAEFVDRELGISTEQLYQNTIRLFPQLAALPIY